MSLRIKIDKDGQNIDQYGRVLEYNHKGELVPTGRCTSTNH